MSALDYSDVVAGLLAILKSDARLEDVQHVTDEPHQPTAEQCPALLVDVGGFARVPRRMVAMIRTASPYDEEVDFEVQCWIFSAHGPADARRRRDDLVGIVMDVIADNPTLGGRVSLAQCLRGDFRTVPTEGGGIFACGRLSVTIEAQT